MDCASRSVRLILVLELMKQKESVVPFVSLQSAFRKKLDDGERCEDAPAQSRVRQRRRTPGQLPAFPSLVHSLSLVFALRLLCTE